MLLKRKSYNVNSAPNSTQVYHMLEQDLVKPLKGFEDNKVLKEQNSLLTFCLSVRDRKYKTNHDY